jgi:hypothetical protein
MKAHKDKIRATFYIDKKLYQLLKRCSQIEEIPMSSIINDEILKDRVGIYELDTPDHVNDYLYAESQEAEKLQQELNYEAYENSADGWRNSQRHKINTMLEKKMISRDEAEKQLVELEEKYEAKIEEEMHEEALRKKALRDRWIKAVAEIPID